MEALLTQLLTDSPLSAEIGSVDAWWQRHHDRAQAYTNHYQRAVIGGFSADRLGYAFASGYFEALQTLMQRNKVQAQSDKKIALCATEEKGGHPRAIQTRLEESETGWTLSGAKRWTTLGTRADVLLVVAKRGHDEKGRPRLCLLRIPGTREGVTVKDMDPIAFVPEIPHATLAMDRVRVEEHEILPGDGYLDYLKPFRTIEDVHVHGALFGWLLQVARRSGWPEEIVARLCELIAGGAGIAQMAPLAPATHATLGGLLASSDGLVTDLRFLWDKTDDATRQRWFRDEALLLVAQKARAQRLEAAWRDLGTSEPVSR